MMATKCSICWEKYEKQGDKIPKLLPCSHTVCLQCTRQLIENSKLNCPECRTENRVPVRGFPTNRYLIENLDLAKKVKDNYKRTDSFGEERRPESESIIAEIFEEVQANINYRLQIEATAVHGCGPSGTNVQNDLDGIMLNPRFLLDTTVTTQADNRGGPQWGERNYARDENAERARDAESGGERYGYFSQIQKKMWIKIKVNVDAVTKDFCLF